MNNQHYCLPIRIINPTLVNVTLHKDMRVTRLELVQDLDCVAGMRETNEDDEPTTSVSTEIEELLWTLMDKHLTTGNRTSYTDFCLDSQMCSLSQANTWKN